MKLVESKRVIDALKYRDRTLVNCCESDCTGKIPIDDAIRNVEDAAFGRSLVRQVWHTYVKYCILFSDSQFVLSSFM